MISTQKRPVSFSPVYFNQIIYFSLAFGKCVHENEHSQIHWLNEWNINKVNNIMWANLCIALIYTAVFILLFEHVNARTNKKKTVQKGIHREEEVKNEYALHLIWWALVGGRTLWTHQLFPFYLILHSQRNECYKLYALISKLWSINTNCDLVCPCATANGKMKKTHSVGIKAVKRFQPSLALWSFRCDAMRMRLKIFCRNTACRDHQRCKIAHQISDSCHADMSEFGRFFFVLVTNSIFHSSFLCRFFLGCVQRAYFCFPIHWDFGYGRCVRNV